MAEKQRRWRVMPESELQRVAAAYNDLAAYPKLQDVADALGYSLNGLRSLLTKMRKQREDIKLTGERIVGAWGKL